MLPSGSWISLDSGLNLMVACRLKGLVGARELTVELGHRRGAAQSSGTDLALASVIVAEDDTGGVLVSNATIEVAEVRSGSAASIVGLSPK